MPLQDLWSRYDVSIQRSWPSGLSAGAHISRPALTTFLIFSRCSRVQILDHAFKLGNWLASCQLGFLTMLCSFWIISFPLRVEDNFVFIFNKYIPCRRATVHQYGVSKIRWRRHATRASKKQIGLISKTTTLHVHHAFFCTFLYRHCTTTTWKCLVLRFTEDVNKQGRNFPQLSFSFQTWIRLYANSPGIQLQESSHTFGKVSRSWNNRNEV